jgi:hypothetical protein
MSCELAFLIAVLVGVAGGLAWLRFDLEAERRTLAGGESRVSKRAKALFTNMSEASDALDCEMARRDLQAYTRARLIFTRHVSQKVARAVSFLGAALGLIELALGTALGEVRWTGVVCLGLGAVGRLGISWMGRDLARQAERVHQTAHTYCAGRPQTFVVGGP